MMVASLLTLRPGERLVHKPTNNPGVVLTKATPSRRHGYRAQVRGMHATVYLTPNNVGDWEKAPIGEIR